MITHNDRLLILMFLTWLLLAMMACNIIPNAGGTEVTPTFTPTATLAPNVDKTKTLTSVVSGLMTPEITLTPNRCKGISGELEMKILVGPAAAVGLEPFSVGQIPFTVTSQDPYTMQGKTHLSYAKTMNY